MDQLCLSGAEKWTACFSVKAFHLLQNTVAGRLGSCVAPGNHFANNNNSRKGLSLLLWRGESSAVRTGAWMNGDQYLDAALLRSYTFSPNKAESSRLLSWTPCNFILLSLADCIFKGFLFISLHFSATVSIRLRIFILRYSLEQVSDS